MKEKFPRDIATNKGFRYFLTDEILKEYENKSIKLRLKWLYQINKFRHNYPKEIIRIQEKFRKGKI